MIKRIMLIAAIVLLVAGTAQAGLGDKLSQLLGIESPTEALAAPAASGGPQELAVWLLGTPSEIDNPDAEISARLGWRNDDVEFGAQFDAGDSR
jgi:hypothetical protein